jgi:hypothetical protein
VIRLLVHLLQLSGDLANTHTLEWLILTWLRRGDVGAVLEWGLLVPLSKDPGITNLSVGEI